MGNNRLKSTMRIAVALCMLLGAAACSPTDPSVSEAPGPSGAAAGTSADGVAYSGSLEIWTDKTFSDEANQAVLDAAADFGALYGVSVEATAVPWDGYVQKIIAAIEANAMPDITVTQSGLANVLYNRGLLAECGDVLEYVEAVRGDAYPVYLKEIEFDGTIVGMPAVVQSHVLMYRTDLFEAHGLGVPDTWEDILEASRILADPANDFYGIGFAISDTLDASNFDVALLNSYGMRYVSEDGTKITFASDETLAGLTFLKELFPYMPPASTGWDDAGDNLAYIAGNTAMVINGGTVLTTLENDDPEMRAVTGVTLHPAGPAGRINNASSRTYHIFQKDGANVETAKGFLKHFYVDTDYYDRYLEGFLGTYSPGFQGDEQNALFQQEVPRIYLNNAANAVLVGWPGPITEMATEVNNTFVIAKACQAVVTGQKTPEQAMADTHEELKRIWESYGYPQD